MPRRVPSVFEQECNHCHEMKPANQFDKNGSGVNGLRRSCKSCMKVSSSPSPSCPRAIPAQVLQMGERLFPAPMGSAAQRPLPSIACHVKPSNPDELHCQSGECVSVIIVGPIVYA